MKKINLEYTLYTIKTTDKFDKQLRKIERQNKDLNKLMIVISMIANKQRLGFKYRNHKLSKSKEYKDCFECHIEPDWLLIYKIQDDKLLLLLFATGSHSDLF